MCDFNFIVFSTVPETQAKKIKRNDALRAAAKKNAANNRAYRKKLRAKAMKSAEQYVKEYKERENNEIRNRRLAKQKGQLYTSPRPRWFLLSVFVYLGSPKTRKILQLLRLRQIHNGVFVREQGHHQHASSC